MPALRIDFDGLVIEATISLLHARVITLFATWGAEHCAREPAHIPILLARIVQTIEAALQDTPRAHTAWCQLSESAIAVHVSVSELEVRDGSSTGTGGQGGGGAWPGGGGGGGGTEGTGGDGGAGALLSFLLSTDGSLVDVEALVMPGTSTWTCPHDVRRKLVYGCGGGAGGGGGVV